MNSPQSDALACLLFSDKMFVLLLESSGTYCSMHAFITDAWIYTLEIQKEMNYFFMTQSLQALHVSCVQCCGICDAFQGVLFVTKIIQ